MCVCKSSNFGNVVAASGGSAVAVAVAAGGGGGPSDQGAVQLCFLVLGSIEMRSITLTVNSSIKKNLLILSSCYTVKTPSNQHWHQTTKCVTNTNSKKKVSFTVNKMSSAVRT